MTTPISPDRREALKKIVTGGAALATGAAFISHEEEVLAAQLQLTPGGRIEQLATEGRVLDIQDIEVDALAGASRLHTDWSRFADLRRPMRRETIRGLDISQMFMGGNLIGGWAHARDLLYVSPLVIAYHTRDKIIATLSMAEACGINTYLGHDSHIGILNDYWDNTDGTMRFIADSSTLDGAIRSLDLGASAAYIQGAMNDTLVREERFDVIEAFIDRMRRERAVFGLGAHHLETIKVCVERGYEPDFWMKTIHSDNYWSRKRGMPEHNNVWCREPDEVITFMNALPQPWIGFKVLAAGALRPQYGFRYAFEAGADFICVGMYDFQVVDNVNICMDILESDITRERPWCFT
jgi:hypothetical protein